MSEDNKEHDEENELDYVVDEEWVDPDVGGGRRKLAIWDIGMEVEATYNVLKGRLHAQKHIIYDTTVSLKHRILGSNRKALFLLFAGYKASLEEFNRLNGELYTNFQEQDDDPPQDDTEYWEEQIKGIIRENPDEFEGLLKEVKDLTGTGRCMPVNILRGGFLEWDKGFTALKEFSESEFNAENLYFWAAVKEYKDLWNAGEEESATSKAGEIYSLYIDEDAEYTINISHNVRGLLTNGETPVDVNLFDSAENEIISLIASDTFLRFTCIENYQVILIEYLAL